MLIVALFIVAKSPPATEWIKYNKQARNIHAATWMKFESITQSG